MARFSITAAGGGSVRYRGCPVYHGTYLKPSYLEFREIASDAPIDWSPGDYVDYGRTGLRYLLYDLPECVQNSEKDGVAERYVYSSVRFYARTEDLERCVFRDLVAEDNTVHFSSRKTFSTCEALDGVARRIQACLDADYPGEWSVETDTGLAASVPSVSEERELSVESGETVLSVLDKVYSLWENVGWTHAVDASTGKNRLVIGGANTRRADNTVAGGSIGRGAGLTSVKVTYSKMDEVCTRLYPFGSTRNMRARYYNSLGIKDAESADIPNLMIPVSEWGKTDSLPDPRKAFIRVSSARDERLLGVRRRVVYFDDETYGEIYPSIEGVTIGDVRGAMSSSDKYYPSEDEYADADRADEVKSASDGALDDGTGSEGAVTQTVSPELDASVSGSVGVSGSVTLTKSIGSAELTMGRWSDILLADGQASIHVTVDSGVSLDGAWLTLEQMGNEARVELLSTYETAYDRYLLSVPDGCVLGHEGFFTVSDTPNGGSFILFFGLEVMASGSRYLQSSSVKVSQSNATPVEVSLRDGRPSSVRVALRQIGFDLNGQRATEGGRIGTLEMKTGACAGRSFRIEKCSYSESGDEWALKVRRVTDRSVNMTFPNTTYPIKAGDRFVITDIRMPDRYIEYASQRLLKRAKEVLAELSTPTAVLTPSVDAKFVAENGTSLVEGRFLDIDASLLSQGYLSIGAYSDLIDTITINEGDSPIPTYSITLRERPRKSFRTESAGSDSIEEVGSSDGGSVSSSAGAKGDKGDQGDKGDKGDKGDPGKDGVGISSVEQTSESEASGGENVVTVTLTDGTASEFRVRNGAKGDPGEQGPKGDDGKDGNPGASGKDGVSAGFGTPTATATALAAGSVPTVDVTATGPDTAKVFRFAFGIPRGKSGDGSGGGAETMAYPDFLDLADKDAETLYAVTYKGACDLWLGDIRITNNITAVLPDAIALSGASVITGGKGATAQYTAALSPSGATERGVTFRCAGSAASIAPSGVLTASGRGEVTVTAASLARPSVRSAGLKVSVNETMELRLSGGGFDGAAAKFTYLFASDELQVLGFSLVGAGYAGGSCAVDADGVANLADVIANSSTGNILLVLAADAECSDYIEAATVTVEALEAVEAAWNAVDESVAVDTGDTPTVADPSWDMPSSYAYDKDGSNTPTAQITDGDNAGWTLSLPDWISAEGNTTSGTGSFSLMLAADANTGAERSGEILLKSADGTVTYARCSVTQAGSV